MINYDARLFRRRKIKHFEAEFPDRLIELRNRGKLLRILNMILRFDEKGISHQKLADEYKLDRKTLRKYTKWLIERGLIVRDGKSGKYFAASMLKTGINMSADAICRNFLEITFDSIKKEERFFSLPIEQRLSSLKDLEFGPLKEIQSKYIRPRAITEKPDEIDLERILFDFSNIIGGFVTYILIQSLNMSNEISKDGEDFEEKGLLIQKWVADVVSVLSEELLSLFEKYTAFHYSHSVAQANNTTINHLILAYSNTYSGLFKKLKNIMKKVHQENREEIDQLKRLQRNKK